MNRGWGSWFLVGLFLAQPFLGWAQSQTIDPSREVQEATSHPTSWSMRVVSGALSTVNDTIRSAQEISQGQEERLFFENFEGEESLEERGWREERIGSFAPSRGWFLEKRDPAAYYSGQSAVVVHDGEQSLGLLAPRTLNYAGNLDNRIVTPVIDLRYVLGRGGETDESWKATLVANTSLGGLLERAAQRIGSYTGGNVLGILDFLRAAALLEPSDLPLTQERYGLGLVNLTFYHQWDFDPQGGGWLEIRYEKPDGTWTDWRPLAGDLVFELSPDLTSFREGDPFCAPRVESSSRFYKQTLGVGGLLTSVTNPLLDSFVHLCDPSTVLDRNFGSGPIWKTLACSFSVDFGPFFGDLGRTPCPEKNPYENPSFPQSAPVPGSFLVGGSPLSTIPFTLSGLLERVLHGETTYYYNGYANTTPEFSNPDYMRGTPAFVGQSPGIVKTHLTLNRFIGTKIQIGFHAFTKSSNPSGTGWFIDSVQVTALVPRHDVGFDSPEAPLPGDVVAPGTLFRPSVLLRNFGNRTSTNVTVEFSLYVKGSSLPILTDNVTVPPLAPLSGRRVTSFRLFSLPRSGDYFLNVTLRPADTNVLNGTLVRNWEDTFHDNNFLSLPLRSDLREKIEVSLRVPQLALQTDVGEPKKGLTVALLNRGNYNLSGGTLNVTVTRISPSTGLPVDDPILLGSSSIAPTELPYGKDWNSLGSERKEALRTFDWTKGTEEGVYLLEAVFTSRDTGSRYVAKTPLYVRSTPLPYFSFNGTLTPYPLDGFEPSDVRSQGWVTWGYENFQAPERYVNATPLVDPGSPSRTGAFRGVPTPGRGPFTNLTKGGASCGALPSVGSLTFGNTCGVTLSSVDSTLYDATYLSPFDTIHDYPLAFDIDLRSVPPTIASLTLSFWSSADFNWKTPGPNPNVNVTWRGIVDVVPWQNNTRPPPPLSYATLRTLSLLEAQGVENETVRSSLSNLSTSLPLLSIEDPHPWKRFSVEIPRDLVGRNITLRFILETRETRPYAQQRGNPGQGCGDSDVTGQFSVLKETVSSVYRNTCSLTDVGNRTEWLLDNIRLVSKGSDGREIEIYRNYAGDTTPPSDVLDKLPGCTRKGAVDPLYKGNLLFLSGYPLPRDPQKEILPNATTVATEILLEPYCRGWSITHFGVDPARRPQTAPSYYFPTVWHFEEKGYVLPGRTDTTGSLRFGNARGDLDYVPRRIVWAGVRTPFFSLSAAQDPILTFVTNYSFDRSRGGGGGNTTALETSLANTCGNPNLKTTYPSLLPRNYVLDGGMVWIRGIDPKTGKTVVHDLLFPEGGYDDSLQMSPCGINNRNGVFSLGSVPEASEMISTCKDPIRLLKCRWTGVSDSREAFVKNVFSYRSGVPPYSDDPSRWVEKRFSLKNYTQADLRNLLYSLEFIAVKQNTFTYHVPGIGWLIDNIEVRERTPANDVSVTSILSPREGESVGSSFCLVGGIEVYDLKECVRKDALLLNSRVVSVVVTNLGLYSQRGVNVTLQILQGGVPTCITYRRISGIDYSKNPNASVECVREVSTSTGFTPETTLPGLLDDTRPDKNRTVVFPIEWTPEKPGIYDLVVRADLSKSEAPEFRHVDGNPLNDLFLRTLEVKNVRSVRLAPPFDPEDLPSSFEDCRAAYSGFSRCPSFGYVGAPVTLSIPVQNRGTLPEIFSPSLPLNSSFYLEVLVRREGTGALEGVPIVERIHELGASDSRLVLLPNIWTPKVSGIYTIEFRLHHPTDPDPTDNVRYVNFTVYDPLVPRLGENLSSLFVPEGAWRFDAEGGPEGAWVFGRGDSYPPDEDSSLVLRTPVNLRSIRNLFLIVNHSYDFEEGYDGGIVEVGIVRPNGTVDWRPLPPLQGYPSTLTSASGVSKPGEFVPAFTGSSGGWRSDAFNLGSLSELVRKNVTLLDERFLNRSNPDLVPYPQLVGKWSSDEERTIVKPHSGTKMYFSDKMALACAGLAEPTVQNKSNAQVNTDLTPRTGSTADSGCQDKSRIFVDTTLSSNPTDPTQAGQVRKGYYVSDKFLNKTLDLSSLSPTDTLLVSFWDWRALGIPYWVGSQNNEYVYKPPNPPPGVSFQICCSKESGKPIVLIPFTETPDLYRDWTFNSFVLPPASLDTSKPVTLTWIHRVVSGAVRGVSQSTSFSSADTDGISNAYGWAIDDVLVQRKRASGAIETILFDGMENTLCHTNPSNGCGWNGKGWNWTGRYESTSYHPSTMKPANPCLTCSPPAYPNEWGNRSAWRIVSRVGPEKSWDVRDSSPPSLCGSVRIGDTTNGSGFIRSLNQLLSIDSVPRGGFCSVSTMSHNQPSITIQAGSRTELRRQPTTPGVTGGPNARFITPLDLRASVGNVHLTFQTLYKLSNLTTQFGGRTTEVGQRSCFLFEVSEDGGTTWIPVPPVESWRVFWDGRRIPISSPWGVTYPASPFKNPLRSTYTQCAGRALDPERNSPFGFPSMTFIDSGSTCFDPVKKSESGTQQVRNLRYCEFTFDLSKFQGKRILLGWHVSLSTDSAATGETVGTQGNLKGVPDFVFVGGVKATSDVLDAGEILLRFRATSDSNVQNSGWKIQNVTMIGLGHLVNGAVKILSPDPTKLYRAGETSLPVSVEVANRGQLPLTHFTLSVETKVTNPSGDGIVNTTHTYSGGIRSFASCDSTPTPSDDTLLPGVSIRICGFREGAVVKPLVAETRAGFQTNVTARISHDLDKPKGTGDYEIIVDDNKDSITIPSSNVLSEGRLVVREVSVEPAVINASRSEGEVRLQATVENQGLDPLPLLDLQGKIQGPKNEVEQRSLDLRMDALAPGVSFLFRSPRETHTYTWILPQGTFSTFPNGSYTLTVTAAFPTPSGRGSTDSTTTFIVTRDLLKTLLVTNVTKAPELCTRVNLTQGSGTWCSWTNVGGGESLNEYSTKGGNSGDCKNNGGGWGTSFVNSSPSYSFTEKSFTMDPQCPVGSDQTATQPPACTANNACPAGTFSLISPKIDVGNFVGPGQGRGTVTFQERRSQGDPVVRRVLTVISYKDSASPGSEIPVVDFSKSFGETTADYALKKFQGRSIDITSAIAEAKSKGATSVRLAFDTIVPYQRRADDWNIDDIVIGPYGVTLGPREEAFISDRSDKTFRIVLKNSGGVEDSYKVFLREGNLQAPTLPPTWNVTLLDSEGRILDQTPPVRDPTILRFFERYCPARYETRRSDPIVLGPGREALIQVRVCVATLPSLAGREGTIFLPVTAVSQTSGVLKASTTFTFRYLYRTLPDLRVDVPYLSPEDASLPAGRPRAVEVTVRNLGFTPAKGVLLELEDVSAEGALALKLLDGTDPVPIPTIPPGEYRTLSFLWTPQFVGPHTLVAHVDPHDRIPEIDEFNNEARRSVVVPKASYPDLVVFLDSSTSDLRVGEPVTFTLRVENKGGVSATGVRVSLRAGATDLLQNLDGSPYIVPSIPPGESIVLARNWTPFFPGKVLVVASALPLAGVRERVETQGDNLRALPLLVRSLSVGVAWKESTIRARPHEAPTTSVVLVNGGEAPDSFLISFEGPPGVRAFAFHNQARTTVLPLSAGESANLDLLLDLPSKIEAGDYPFTLVVTSLNSTLSKSSSIVLRVEEVRSYELSSGTVTLRPGSSSVNLTVLNEGNTKSTLHVEPVTVPEGWGVESSPAVVAPYSRSTLSVTVRSPTGAEARLYDLLLRVVDEKGYSSEATLTVNLLSMSLLEPSILLSRVNASPLSTVEIPLEVTNVGNVRGEATLSFELPEGWNVTLSRTLLSLSPGRSARATALLQIPSDAAGSYVLRLVSRGEGEVRAPLLVHVESADLSIEELRIAPRSNLHPGDTVSLSVTLRNTGERSSTNTTLGIYLDDVLLAAFLLPPIPPNGAETRRAEWIALPGDHAILAVADAGNSLRESDEGNNARMEVVSVEGSLGLLQGALPAVAGFEVVAVAVAGVLGAALLSRKRR